MSVQPAHSGSRHRFPHGDNAGQRCNANSKKGTRKNVGGIVEAQIDPGETDDEESMKKRKNA